MNNPKTLPLDIILQIFSKANLETLIQCRRVCKSWLASLSDPAILQSISIFPKCLFLHSFLKNSDSRSIQLYALHKLPSRDNALLKLRAHIKPSARDGTIIIVGSYNGLLCEFHQERLGDAYFRVSNPITGGSVTVVPKGARRGPIGFGFCPDTNQYKLVELVQKCDDEFEARVLTLCSSGKSTWNRHSVGQAVDFTWRRVPCQHSYKYKTLRALEIGRFVNGALHWWNVVESEVILVFDLGKEQFSALPPPGIPRANDYLKGSFVFSDLLVIKNCLTICCRWYSTLELDPRLEIWAMRDYGIGNSWVRVRQFKENQFPCDQPYLRSSRRRNHMDHLEPLMLYKTRKNMEMTLCKRKEGGYAKLYTSHSATGEFSLIDLALPDFEAIVDYVPSFLSPQQLF